MSSYTTAQLWQQAERDWASGKVIPWRITTALDADSLYGPEVDLACGVEEPAVDRWEAGTLYPTWEQLCALAELCQTYPWMFTEHITDTGPVRIFICRRGGRGRGCQVVDTSDRITTFTDEAIAAANLPKPRPPSPTQPPLGPRPRRMRVRRVA